MSIRISKETKAIADRHLEARAVNKFDNPEVKTKDDVIGHLRNGKTIEGVLTQIEARFCSVTSTVLNRMGHNSQAYKRQVYHGFKILLQKN